MPLSIVRTFSGSVRRVPPPPPAFHPADLPETIWCADPQTLALDNTAGNVIATWRMGDASRFGARTIYTATQTVNANRPNLANLLSEGIVIAASNIRAAEAVTPADATDLPLISTYSGGARALYVGGAGNVTIRTATGNLTFVGVTAGAWYPLPPYLGVEAAGTTATSLIAGY